MLDYFLNDTFLIKYAKTRLLKLVTLRIIKRVYFLFFFSKSVLRQRLLFHVNMFSTIFNPQFNQEFVMYTSGIVRNHYNYICEKCFLNLDFS